MELENNKPNEPDQIIRLRGSYEMVLGDANGVEISRNKVDNIVVTSGRSWVLKQIASSLITTSQSIGFIAVGTGTTAPTTADTGLGSENTRIAISSFTTTNINAATPSWRAEAVFATNQANTTLGEVGMFNSSSGGTMLSRSTFNTVNKTTSNTFSISYTLSN